MRGPEKEEVLMISVSLVFLRSSRSLLHLGLDGFRDFMRFTDISFSQYMI